MDDYKANFKVMYFTNGNVVRELRIKKNEYYRINSGKAHPYSELTEYIKGIVAKGYKEIDIYEYLRRKYRR